MAPLILAAFSSFAIFTSTFALSIHSNTRANTPPSYQPDDSIVKTSSGLLRPLQEAAFPDVDQFLGVPFAQPPLGDLRFAPPQPYRPDNNEVFNATILPPGCLAPVATVESVFDVYEPGMTFHGPMSEDCLKLDVYRPRNQSSEPLPVMIFVYGGGFSTGAANKSFSIPTPWVQDKQNVIVVALQYRLNVFGFPNTAALAQNNVGFEDIRFAVEWVKKNIAAFGGDVEHMTLWGHSAGSVAVNAYTFAYPDDMIVQSTISMSGVVMSPTKGWQSQDHSHSNFTFIANQLGCQGSDVALLSCMRKQPASSITKIAYDTTNALTFKPVSDGNLIFANYTERLLNGNFAKQPAIIGNSRREGERQLATLSTTAPNKTEVFEYTIVAFICPSELTSKLRYRAGVPTYRYEFKGNFTNISPLPWMGAYHESPLPYVFGQTNNKAGHPTLGSSTPFELDVSSHMQDLWQAFAADPQSLATHWDWPLYEGGAPRQSTDAVKLIPGRGDHTSLSSIEYGADREDYCAEVDPYLISQMLPPGLDQNVGVD